MSKFSIKTAAVAAVVGGVLAGATTASAALQLPTSNCSYSFNSNMKLGSTGADVMNLQKVLNMYPQTRVAETGAGSPGMETMKFGPATKAAVNKFQALHLADLGITAPTGNVFAGTRGLLNQICLGGSTGSTGSTGNTGTTGNVVNGPVSVMVSASQPTGMLVSGQAGAALANLTFTGNGTVSSVELQRIGVSTDSTLTNVYLYDGNVRITDAASVVTGGYIRFNAASGLFAVNGTRTITVRADIASGITGSQTVGVKVNSVTALGSSASTFTNMMGNSLSIGTVTTATVNFNALVTTARNVDAGTTGYNVWDATANVGTRDVTLKAATFKFVGSAPVDSVANLSLYVDGAKVAGPAMINPLNNNKVVFDLGSTGYLMKTGSHQVSVRGDIVKGSSRNLQFSIENAADLMLEDRDLSGVNVAATVGGSSPISNTSYGIISVNTGSVVVNVDPSFVASKVTGGATNMTIGSFTMKAYGEDVKVTSLNVTPSLGSMTPAAAGLSNVGLYLNGGQIGSSQNFTGSTLTYNLGSSLIIPAGQTVTVSVKSDIKTTGSASYTAGPISATIAGASNNAQGMSSNQLTTVASGGVTGNTLTVSSGAGNYGRTSGFAAANVAPNTTAVKIASYTVQADSSEDTVVNSATINLSVGTYALTNLTNLTLKTGNTTLGTPIGNVNSSNVVSFSDVVVPMNGTKTFDVYADIGSATVGSTTATLDLSTRGPVSGTTATLSGTGTGVAITSQTATLGTPILVSSSPVSQYVVGGTSVNVATFKLKTAQDSTANVRELRFTIAGTDSVESVTVGGVNASVVGTLAKATGLNIAIGQNGTDIPVTVKYSGFKNSTTGGSLTSGVTSTTTLTYIEATSGNGSVISLSPAISANPMYLVASKPTVTVNTTQQSGLILGAENKIGEVTVTADANGSINVHKLKFSSGASGLSGALTLASARLADGSATIPNVTCAIASTVTTCTFSTDYSLSAGQSKTFSLYAVPTGTVVAGATVSVSTQVSNAASDFQWVDVVGGNTTYDGTAIYNFPTSSYSVKQ